MIGCLCLSQVVAFKNGRLVLATTKAARQRKSELAQQRTILFEAAEVLAGKLQALYRRWAMRHWARRIIWGARKLQAASKVPLLMSVTPVTYVTPVTSVTCATSVAPVTSRPLRP